MTEHTGFENELRALRAKIGTEIGTADLRHLKKIEWWGRLCSIAGYATAWIFPNPFSAWCIAQGSVTRWAIMMHHVGHKGYDKTNGPARFTSAGFAKGYRRYIDWFDWMHPAAWKHEHNILHHYHTGEQADPDLVERNVELIRNAKIPRRFKYLALLFFMCTWKFTYYAPNTYWMYLRSKKEKSGKQPASAHLQKNYPGLTLLSPFSKDGIRFWFACLLPYAALRFIILPILFLPVSPAAALFVLINSLLAELIINIYTFIIIVPNHAGEDLYRFEDRVHNAGEFYRRQVIGSANYSCGNDRTDFMHGWLNYQIEHHLFPDIPLLKYQQYQPAIKAICNKYNVPYVQESVWKRFRKMTEIVVGKKSMRTQHSLPG